MFIRAGIITASDRSARGEREDLSGPLLKGLLESLPAEVVAYRVLPDEKGLLTKVLLTLIERFHCDLIVTTGGTGLSPRDVTPEATRGVIEKEVPGIAEAIRRAGAEKKETALLSRALAGIRGKTLIVNLPGSPSAVQDAFEVLRPVLPHALEILRGEVTDCRSFSHSSHS